MATITAMLFLGRSGQSVAADSSPDLRMLLNLDLFDAPASGTSADDDSVGPGNSMLDQIRALSAMGYLGSAQGTAQVPGIVAPYGGDGSRQTPADEQGVPLL